MKRHHLHPGRWLALCSLTAILLCLVPDALGITRQEVMVRARSYAYHPWRCAAANLTASCSSSYKSAYIPGDYMGLPYDWGGYMTLFEFDQQTKKGFGAGSYAKHGVLSCTAGLDCSGYVSKCWDAGHFSTSTLYKTSSTISKAAVLPGDAFNQAGYHVILYSHTLKNGDPVFYEAAGYNVHVNVSGGWSYTSGYTPVRYNKITGTTAGNPPGTLQNPISITSFPYTDSRNTAQSLSDVLDGCGADPTKDESGPEYVYQATFSKPGKVTVSVSDDVGVDIDVHLYGAKNTNNCLARNDSAFTYQVDCGSYYVVADTFRSNGKDQAGAYNLKVTFTPSAKACGAGPKGYAPKGKMGDKCAYPGNSNLPFCNENLGASTCIYTSTTSFCSKACKAKADCAAFAGGCCKDISGKGEYYCLPASSCGGTVKKDSGSPKQDSGSAKKDNGSAKKDSGVTKKDATQDGAPAQKDSGATTEAATGPDAAGGDGDAGGGEEDEGGCGCGVSAPHGGGWSLLLLVALFGGALIRRRRHRYCVNRGGRR